MDRPHLRPSHRFLTRTLPFLAVLTLGVAYITAPPMARAEASWNDTGCVTGKTREAGKRYSGIINAQTPDLNVVTVSFPGGRTMDFTSPGPIKAEPGDLVRADLSSSIPFDGNLGEYFATNKVNAAVSNALDIRRRAMLGVDHGNLPLTSDLNIVKPQGCANSE